MTTPLISVIIPVYNLEPYIDSCIKSILNQTYTNLEIIIIDDASTDGTHRHLAQHNDKRIRLYRNDINLGLAASVNDAIRKANGKYLARMDGDDLADLTRFEKQVTFLEEHAELDIVGTAMKSFGYSNFLHHFPTTHAACKCQLLFNVCFGHPSVLMRKSIFSEEANFYNEELRQYSEEYELWCRLVDKFKFANLAEPLIKYRTFSSLIKNEADSKRIKNSFLIRKNFLNAQLGVNNDLNFKIHDDISNLRLAHSENEIETWIQWLKKIESLNEQIGAFDCSSLRYELSKRLFELLYKNRQFGYRNVNRWYFEKGKIDTFKPSLFQHLKFIVRSIVKR